MNNQKTYITNIFQLPGILLPASILAIQIILGNTAADIHLHDTYIVMPFGLYLSPEYIIVLISYVLHIMLRNKRLISSRWLWLHAIITILPFILFAIVAVNWPNHATGNRAHFVFPPLSYGRLLLMRGLFASLVIACIAQLVFWVYAIIVLVRPAKSNPAINTNK